MSMTEDELKGKIVKQLWTWRYDIPLYPLEKTNMLLALFREAGWKSPEELKGWGQLAEDQSLPGCPRFNYFDIDACEWKYDLELLQTHCPLLKAGFLKVVKP